MENILAESKRYKIVSEFEKVELVFKNHNPSIVIGDFYGDPNCAIISEDEKYAVIAGCGLIIYKIDKPFEAFEYNKQTNQYFEFGREPGEISWIDSLSLLGEHNFIFETVKESFDFKDNSRKYKMKYETGELELIE